ncbi:alpha/beta hydrolase [Pseudomonas silensiensis]|uniref:alpha/beta hydrolase n=1 Tax=Pseudomonas silensiensis TaxID=2991049 RepID=UPI003D1C405B
MPLHPQAKAALELLALMPPMDYSMDGAQIRAALAKMPEGESPFSPGDEVQRIEDVSIEGSAGRLSLRLYYPDAESPLPITLYLHGGGFVFGSPQMHDNVCRCLANRAACLVVSVDYRLAPEAKFPAALDDGLTALNWIITNATSLGGDPSRIAIAGDSAGGNLATVIANIDAQNVTPTLRHQVLLYPVTDCRFDSPSYRARGEDYFLTTEMMQWYWKQYLPDQSAANDPRASPLRATLSPAVAPATVITAEYDPLCDEGEAYAKALRAVGVVTRLHRWEGQIHGFASMLGVIDAADEALSVAATALQLAFKKTQ